MPKSERTQRISVLVTTQMKVSSGIRLPFRQVEEKHERLAGAELRLHLPRGKRRRARKRGVIRELRRQFLIDLLYPRIDGGEPCIVLCLGFWITLGGLLAESGVAQRIARLPFRYEVLALTSQRRKLRIALRAARRHLRQGSCRLRA